MQFNQYNLINFLNWIVVRLRYKETYTENKSKSATAMQLNKRDKWTAESL